MLRNDSVSGSASRKTGATDYALKQGLDPLAPAVCRALDDAGQQKKQEHAEDAAHEIRGRLELALDAANLASWEWHFSTGEVQFSDRWWRTLGYMPNADGARLEYWERLAHPEDLPRMRNALAAHLDGSAPILEVEYRMLAHNGAWRWIHTVGKVTQHDATGQPLRLSGTHNDVTARMQVREALQALVAAGGRDRDTRYSAYITQCLTQILEVGFAFVALLAGEENDSLRTLAWRVDGSLADNIEYSIAGTPCAEVVNGQPATFADGVQQQFPEDDMLADLGVSAYSAVPLLDAAGHVIGHVGVMSRQTFVDPHHVEHIVQLFAGAVAAEILRERSEQQFHGLFEFSADAMIMADERGTIRLVNRAVEHVFGYQAAELIGQPVEILMAETARAAHVDYREQYLQQAEPRPMSTREVAFAGVRRDGSEFAIDVGLMPLQTDFGTTVTATVRDITQKQRQEAKIHRLSRIRVLLSGINSTIVRVGNQQILFDEACRIAVNEGGFAFAWIGLVQPGASKVTLTALAGLQDGYLEEVGKILAGITDDPGIAGGVLRQKQAIVANDIANDPQVVFKDEALRRGFRSVAAFPLIEADKVVGVFVLYATVVGFFDPEEVSLLTELAGDISFAIDSIRKGKKLNFLAYYDPLTELPNRSLMHDRCNQILRGIKLNGPSVALILIDIDRFRQVNASFGRSAGDRLLQRVARDLTAALPPDSNLARLHADCFAVLVTDIKDAPAAARLFDDVLAPTVSQPFQLGSGNYQLSVHGGAALAPADGRDAESLLRNAEAALNRAKHQQERLVFYEAQMSTQVAERLTMEGKLRRAVERNEFVLYYQPKFDAQTRAISGLEALIRWVDPDTGLVQPGKFIPLLEETGIILQVGRWALQQASSDYISWLEDGLEPPRIAVNVSAIQLQNDDFLQTLRDVVALAPETCRHDGGGLDLEITESLLMQDIEGHIRKLEQVRQMGMRISIDDFGTGYSSLGYLARLPIDALKIDRTFVSTMTEESRDLTIVSTIISLAHAMHLSVIAEGVETEEQAKFLMLLKCDELQGFLLGRPVPSDEIVEVLKSGIRT